MAAENNECNFLSVSMGILSLSTSHTVFAVEHLVFEWNIAIRFYLLFFLEFAKKHFNGLRWYNSSESSLHQLIRHKISQLTNQIILDALKYFNSELTIYSVCDDSILRLAIISLNLDIYDFNICTITNRRY